MLAGQEQASMIYLERNILYLNRPYEEQQHKNMFWTAGMHSTAGLSLLNHLFMLQSMPIYIDFDQLFVTR